MPSSSPNESARPPDQAVQAPAGAGVRPAQDGVAAAPRPGAQEPAREEKVIAASAAPPEEGDVWWGSYSGRNLLPGLLVCLVATAFIGWAAWYWLSGFAVKFVFFTGAGAVWLFQGVRQGLRFFGYNYRITTRRLFCHRGLAYFPQDEMELVQVARVAVKRGWRDRLLGVGHVIVVSNDPNQVPLILEGVRKSARVAEMIRVHVRKAREQTEGQAGGTQ
jgi:hypothetical protein